MTGHGLEPYQCLFASTRLKMARLPCWPHIQQVLHQRWISGTCIHCVCLRQVWIRLPLWLWIPEETSPEVQNRDISGPKKSTNVLQKMFKKFIAKVWNSHEASELGLNRVINRWAMKMMHIRLNIIWKRNNSLTIYVLNNSQNKIIRYYNIMEWRISLWWLISKLKNENNKNAFQ